jgi:LytS/YehU family sensor histidine kinase
MDIWELLKQRRIWVTIFSLLSIALKWFGVEIDPDTEVAIIDQTMILISLIPDVINGILALWSFIKPKPKV